MNHNRKLWLVLWCMLSAIVVLTPGFAEAASGASWVQLAPATSPSARAYASMAYDPVSQKVVLFGGYDGVYLNDTWTFDGTNWTKVETAAAPPVRTNAGMAFDRVNRVLVLFGGYNGQIFMGDTWTWNGATSTWKQVVASQSPKAVTGPMLFSDPVSGRVDVYGGFDGNFYQATTYQWSGTTWTNLNPPNPATARSIAVCATDAATKTTVMFGGLGDINPDNTWTWDGKTWTEQNPGTQIGYRYGSPGVYDAHLRRVIVFGGGYGGADISDSWAWNGTDWAQLAPAHSPAAREGFGMAFDSVLQRTVIFGGQAGSTLYGDTWELEP